MTLRDSTQLKNLIRHQIEDLRTAGSTLQHGLMWSTVLFDIPNFDQFDFLRKPTNVQKVLSIYEPDLGPALSFVIEWKSNILTGLAEKFARNIASLEGGKLIVRELVYIDHDLLKRQHSKVHFLETLEEAEKTGSVKFQELDLSIPAERRRYLSRARKRLQEIQAARDQLAKLIQEHYEPHHLI